MIVPSSIMFHNGTKIKHGSFVFRLDGCLLRQMMRCALLDYETIEYPVRLHLIHLAFLLGQTPFFLNYLF